VACSANKVKKVVLAYSGGLDTSVILKWLQDTYECEVRSPGKPAASPDT
jgi:argininosuccinate synthase